MDDWRWVLWILSVVVGLRLLPLLMTLLAILRIRLDPAASGAVESADLGGEIRAWLEDAARPLRALGFEPLLFQPVRDLSAANAEADPRLLLRHPETGTFATLIPMHLPDHRLPFRIDLETPLADGRTLVTFQSLAHMLIGSVPGTVVQDVECMTEAELWQAHRQRLAELGEPLLLDLQGYQKWEMSYRDALIRHLLDTDVIEPEVPGERYRPRLLAAVRLTGRMRRGAVARERFLVRRAAEIAAGRVAAPKVELWQESAAYWRNQRSLANRVPASASLMLLVVTGLASVLGMSLLTDPLFAACLLGVVALHELGHYTAMRLLGYEDTSVFFLPFLGGMTTGQKRNASFSQELIVLLAGPMPGIALGLGLLAVGPELVGPRLSSLLVMLLVWINALNLLPLLPLDGGKVVDRVLIDGRPWATLAVGGVAAVSFCGVALWMRDPALLFFGGLFVLSMRAQLRSLRLLARTRARAAKAASPEERVDAVFQVLAEDPPLSFGRKLQLAHFVETTWSRPRAGGLARATWFAVYTACVVLALAGSIAAVP